MLRSMVIGISGLDANQKALSTIANNIANDQTVGYKMQEAVFEELFYQQYRSPVAPSDDYAGNNPMDIGNGVKISSINTIQTQGNVVSSGNPTDMAIQGEGFFVIGNRESENRLYTRAGNFITSKDNELITKSGQYVLGWNFDPLTGGINTGAQLEPIKVDLGSISEPRQSTFANVQGNLNIQGEVGSVYGVQVPTWDSLGGRHEVNMDFVKTGGNTFQYVATPMDQFRASDSITNAALNPDPAVVQNLQKGTYQLETAVSGTPGMVDVTVIAPDGSTVLTQTISDANQTVRLSDGTNDWFMVDYEGGGAPSTAEFVVGETGEVEFNPSGQITNISGNGPGGLPQISYTPDSTGLPVNIDLNLGSITGISAESNLRLRDTDGSGAATLINYTITDGGIIDGYYSDGTVKQVAQVAMASFSNPAGLSRVGQGNFLPTPNSGAADVGLPGTGSRGQIKAQSVETSNVDLAKQFVDMIQTQKSYQAGTKVIQTSDNILTSVINLIR